jgi:hypothetical protein
MKQRRFLLRLSCAVSLLALLAVNPALEAARKKQATPKKERPANQPSRSEGELFRQKIEQEIQDLRTDVNSRAKLTALQEVKKQADDTAASVKLVTLVGGGIGFLIGCVVTGLVLKRMGKSDAALKIT